MRQAAKVDVNQAEIVEALQRVGANVESLADVGRGVPDLLVGYSGRLLLLEVKSGPRARLTTTQAIWHRQWAGYPVYVVRSVEEALQAIGVEMDG